MTVHHRSVAQAILNLAFDRRALLRGSAATALLAPLHPALAQDGDASPGGSAPGIDIHCHIFNAADLPIRGFVENVVFQLEDFGQWPNEVLPELNDVLPELLELIVAILKTGAPSAAEELALLPAPEDATDPRWNEDAGTGLDDWNTDKERISRAMGEYFAALFTDIADSDILSLFEEPDLNNLLGAVQSGLQIQSRIVLLRRLVDEVREKLATEGADIDLDIDDLIDFDVDFDIDLDLDLDFDMAADLLRGNFSGTDEIVDAMTDALQQVVEHVLDCDGDLCRVIGWTRRFLRYRYQNANRLIALYGEDANLGLVTPAVVDLSYWLADAPQQDSELAAQIEVMHRISLTRDAVKVHGFVPFDPWRDIAPAREDRRFEPPGPSFAMVETAIATQGFVGVKLYPPMGFQPADNHRSERYPRELRRIRGFDDKMNAALDHLFGWCAANGVPVMTHTANSQAAGDDFGERADPRHWLAVLERHPELRLNLAHFGNFTAAMHIDGRPEDTWEWTIGAMMAAPAFPNIYADISHFAEVFNDRVPATVRNRIANLLAQFIEAFDPGLDYLMFGTDWVMTGIERGYRGNVDGVRDLLAEIGVGADGQARVFGGNAARFLGLQSGEQNRGRLEKYYAQHGLDAGWLSRFG